MKPCTSVSPITKRTNVYTNVNGTKTEASIYKHRDEGAIWPAIQSKIALAASACRHRRTEKSFVPSTGFLKRNDLKQRLRKP